MSENKKQLNCITCPYVTTWGINSPCSFCLNKYSELPIEDKKYIIERATPEESVARKERLKKREESQLKALPFSLLSAAINKDPDYAWSWHCNIAMPMVDGGVSMEDANYYAARIMQHIFGVDTSKHEHYSKEYKKL